jgi:flagellar biosynthesis protein FliR
METTSLQILWNDPRLLVGVQTAGVALARIVPVTMLVPLFGGRCAPRLIRLAIGGVLALAITPALMAGLSTPIRADLYILLLSRDLLIGLTLGFAGALVFHAIESAGALVDLSRGVTLAGAFTPGTPNRPAPTATFLGFLAVVLFFLIGGHQLLLAALADSFRHIQPLDLSAGVVNHATVTESVIALSGAMFVLALQLAAPAIIVTLLVDVAAGVLGRLTPTTNAFFLGLTVKGTLAIAAVFVAVGTIAVALRGQLADMLSAVKDLIREFV